MCKQCLFQDFAPEGANDYYNSAKIEGGGQKNPLNEPRASMTICHNDYQPMFTSIVAVQ